MNSTFLDDLQQLIFHGTQLRFEPRQNFVLNDSRTGPRSQVEVTRFDDALQRFLTTYKSADDAGMAAVARWMVITLLELDRAPEAHDIAAGFAEKHPDKAELVKLRYFAGLTIAEAAQALGISTSTADRHWAYARAWLYRRIVGDAGL